MSRYMNLSRNMKETSLVKDLIALNPCGITQRDDVGFSVLTAKFDKETITVFYNHDDVCDFAAVDDVILSDKLWLQVFKSNAAKDNGYSMIYERGVTNV